MKVAWNCAIVLLALWPIAFLQGGFAVISAIFPGPVMGPIVLVQAAAEGGYLGWLILFFGITTGAATGFLIFRFSKKSTIATTLAMLAFYVSMIGFGNIIVPSALKKSASQLPAAFRCTNINSVDDMVISGLDDAWSGTNSFHGITVTNQKIYNWSFKSFSWVSEDYYDMYYFGLTKAQMIEKCASNKRFKPPI
jgi:hypothetical protein